MQRRTAGGHWPNRIQLWKTSHFATAPRPVSCFPEDSKYTAIARMSLVLALPRGGVPVAYEVARALRVPLDVFLVRKLGVPGQEELAMGAIAMGGIRVLNDDVVRAADTAPRYRLGSRERRARTPAARAAIPRRESRPGFKGTHGDFGG